MTSPTPTLTPTTTPYTRSFMNILKSLFLLVLGGPLREFIERVRPGQGWILVSEFHRPSTSVVRGEEVSLGFLGHLKV